MRLVTRLYSHEAKVVSDPQYPVRRPMCNSGAACGVWPWSDILLYRRTGCQSARPLVVERCRTRLPAAGLWQNGKLLLLWEAKRTASCKKAHDERAQYVGGQVCEVGAKTSVVCSCVSQSPTSVLDFLVQLSYSLKASVCLAACGGARL